MTTRLTAAASRDPTHLVRIDSKETAMTDVTNHEADDSTSTESWTVSDETDINLIDSIPIEHDSPMLDAWRSSPLLNDQK